MLMTRRDMLALGCALGAQAALPWRAVSQTQSAATGPASSADPISHVDPQFRAKLEEMDRSFGPMPAFTAAALPAMRKMSVQFGGPSLPSPAVLARTIPGIAGSPDVRVLVAGSTAGAHKPAVLHIHGGGYVTGSAAAGKRDLQQLSLTQNCVVVSVDYRLAPETAFPGSLNDNYAALKWLYTNADSLGVDSKRIAVKGESAGGGHAAALAIAARDRGEVPICFQVLIYPMLDDRTGSTRQLPPHDGHYIWTAASNRFGWSSLLGVPAGSAKVPAGAVPARVTNLAGLPPAFIGVGSIDLFAPEDIDYTQRLLLAGVPVELNVVPGAFHGFDGIVPDAPLSRAFTVAWNDALKRAFEVPSA